MSYVDFFRHLTDSCSADFIVIAENMFVSVEDELTSLLSTDWHTMVPEISPFPSRVPGLVPGNYTIWQIY